MSTVPSDIAIAQAAKMRPIQDVAAELGLGPDDILPYGRYKAKISAEVVARGQAQGAAGAGHRHQSDAGRRGEEHRHGRREPGAPPAGQEGGRLPSASRRSVRCSASRAGRRAAATRRCVPMDEINLHFTGRLPRHHLGAQPAVGDARQPPAPGERAQPRPPPDHLAPHDGHERPVAPLDRDQPRRHQRRARCARSAS